jgi:hypothetical protein
MKTMGLLLLTVFLAVPVTGTAADFSRVDLQPWLRIRTSTFFRAASQGDLLEGQVDRDVYVTKGGALFVSASLRGHPVNAPTPFSTEILRGIGTAAERQTLGTAVTRAEIGFQIDCQLTPSPGNSERHEIIWYGKGTRRNRFVVFLHGTQDPVLPVCSPEVFQLISALITFESAVAVHPDSEVLRSPPF